MMKAKVKEITLRTYMYKYEALRVIAKRKGISVNGLLNIMINQMKD